MDTVLDLAAACSRFPDELQKAQRVGVGRAALHVTREIRQEIRVATGGDMRLSNVGARGARLNARFDVRGTVNPTALIRATGPMQLIEYDTKPHEIRPRRRRGTKVLKLPNGYVPKVRHPGTRGKRPFARGAERGALRSAEKFNEAIEQAMRRTFR